MSKILLFFGHVGTMPIMIEILAVGVVVLVQIISFAVWVGKISQKVNDVKDIVDKRDKYGERLAALESKVGTWNADNIESKSPASLTDKGRLLLKESGAEEFIKNNEKKLLKYFDGIDEPFDIQEKSLEVIEQELRSDKKIKSYLFQKGAKGIKGVAEVAGIALRDVVLKHKSIQV